MTRSPLQCFTSIIRSSALVQVSSSLSTGRTCAWPRRLPVTEMHFRHFSREFFQSLFKFSNNHRPRMWFLDPDLDFFLHSSYQFKSTSINKRSTMDACIKPKDFEEILIWRFNLQGSNQEFHGVELVLRTAPPRMHVSNLDGFKSQRNGSYIICGPWNPGFDPWR